MKTNYFFTASRLNILVFYWLDLVWHCTDKVRSVLKMCMQVAIFGNFSLLPRTLLFHSIFFKNIDVSHWGKLSGFPRFNFFSNFSQQCLVSFLNICTRFETSEKNVCKHCTLEQILTYKVRLYILTFYSWELCLEEIKSSQIQTLIGIAAAGVQM